jgi:hypothetical protein
MSDEKINLLLSSLFYKSLKWNQVISVYWHGDSYIELRRHNKRNITIHLDYIDSKQKESFIKSLRQHLMRAKVEELNQKA